MLLFINMGRILRIQFIPLHVAHAMTYVEFVSEYLLGCVSTPALGALNDRTRPLSGRAVTVHHGLFLGIGIRMF